MFDIILNNYGVWFNLLIPITIGGYLLVTNREMAFREFGIQIALTLIFVIGIYTLMFSVTTDLIDSEQWNGYVTKAMYYEGYEYEYDCSYQSCSGTGKNRTCRTISKTCESWQPPVWKGYSTVGSFSISENQYDKYAKKFGTKEEKIFHSNQTTMSRFKNEGDEWTSTVNIIMPVSLTKNYENLVVAANTNVLNVKTSKADIEMYKKEGKLREYPAKYKDYFGTPHQYRVIDTTNTIDVKDWTKSLDFVAMKVGPAKQANPIIYITDEGPDFKYVLESYWKGAKKNDVVLILGVSGKEVVWSDVIAWTNNTDFAIEIQSSKWGVQNGLTSNSMLMGLIDKYYIRKPMKEFEYLKENITLSWYWQMMIFLANLGLSGMFFYISLRNNIRK